MSRGSSHFAPAAVFALAGEPETFADDLRLTSREWGVLFSVTGRHTVAQIAASLGAERADLESALASLLGRGLIVERSLSLDEYLAAASAAGDDETISLSRFLRARAATANEPVAARVPARREGDALPQSATDSEPPFEPLPLPVNEDTSMIRPPERCLSLRSLLQLILQRAATPDAGQLDVYRTFLRVDPALLRRQGITTLRLEDDRVIRDPELVAAIVESAGQTLAGPVPEAVYVE